MPKAKTKNARSFRTIVGMRTSDGAFIRYRAIILLAMRST